jgi:LEA14-like dessication related protein
MRNIFLLALCIFLFSCRDFQEIQVTNIEGLKVNKISMDGIDAQLLLRLKNPNSMGFSLYRSEFDIRYSGIYLGKAKLTKRVKIRGNAEETYGFHLSQDFRNVNVLDVLNLLKGASIINTIEVTGNLNAGKFMFVRKRIPVNIKEQLKLQ